MAVGKGSMERAAKAAEKKTETETQETEKAPVKKGRTKSAGKAAKQNDYQQNRGILERPALPNESFGLGEDMPIYYF